MVRTNPWLLAAEGYLSHDPEFPRDKAASMLYLTPLDASGWCATRGVWTRGDTPSSKLAIGNGLSQRFRFEPPIDPAGRVALANAIAVPRVLSTGDETFAGGLVWLRDWDIWSNTVERVGLELLRSVFRVVAGSSVRGTPARWYGPGELVQFQTAISLVLLFEWEADIVLEAGSPAFHISHERYVEVATKEVSEHEALQKCFLSAWKQLPTSA